MVIVLIRFVLHIFEVLVFFVKKHFFVNFPLSAAMRFRVAVLASAVLSDQCCCETSYVSFDRVDDSWPRKKLSDYF